MSKKIYGVGLDGKVTAPMVRDAVVKCFYEAHCNDAGFGKKAPVEYCEELIRKAFSDAGGDFDNPNKEILKKVVAGLENFSTQFRDQEVIDNHRDQIVQLINKLE
ncbi:MAG: hypothetical protein ABFQ62_00255 [Patescibacteria group bacterium]